MLGRDVACAAGQRATARAEYTCAEVMELRADQQEVSMHSKPAMLLTNPLTASVLLETARRAGHRAFVQKMRAAGAIGKMLVRLCAREKLPLVNVVRRAEQATALCAIG